MCFGKKEKPSAQHSPNNPPAIRPADDFAIIQQFNQLYMKVRAWSSEFLGGNNPSPSQLPADVVQQIERVLLNDRPSRVMPDKTLHRHIIEGLVGVSVSETLNPQGAFFFVFEKRNPGPESLSPSLSLSSGGRGGRGARRGEAEAGGGYPGSFESLSLFSVKILK